MWLHELYGPLGEPPGLIGIGTGVEPGRGQIFGAIEGELSVPPQLSRSRGKRIDVQPERLGQPGPLCQQHLGDIVNAGRFYASAAKQALEGELHDLLALADDVGPALRSEENVDGLQPDCCTMNVVVSQSWASHVRPYAPNRAVPEPNAARVHQQRCVDGCG